METEALEISRPFEVLKVEHSQLFAKPEGAIVEKAEPESAEPSRPFGVVKKDVSSLLLSQQQQQQDNSVGNPAPTSLPNLTSTTPSSSTGTPTSTANPTPTGVPDPSRPFSVVKNDVSQLLSNMQETSSQPSPSFATSATAGSSKQDSTGKLGKSAASLSTKFEKMMQKEERKKAEKDREKSQSHLPQEATCTGDERDAAQTGGMRFDVFIMSITTTTQQKELMVKACLGDGHSWTSPSLKVA